MKAILFLPWLAFLGQHGSGLGDGAVVRIGLGADCANVTKIFRASVARSLPAKSKGLGGRRNPLGPDEGMLFVYESPKKVAYWMKNTFVPLQIGYFDGTGRLRETHSMDVEADPSRPKRNYPSAADVSVALEVAPRGLAGLRPGKTELCVERPAK